MRLAHLADAHLGHRRYYRSAPDGVNQREADCALAFERVIDDVIASPPDAVVVAGDLFDSVRPSNAATLFAFRQFRRLREALPAAPVVLIGGNHDTPRCSDQGSPLRILGELAVQVATTAAEDFSFPDLGLVVRAVPHGALLAAQRPSFLPPTDARYAVMTLHAEAEGVFAPGDEPAYGGAFVTQNELLAGRWEYVALGHYHVAHQVGDRCWYAGASEYLSSNIWGELVDEAKCGVTGKGWLLVDLDTGAVEHRTIELARRVIDLEPIQGAGLTAAQLNAAIAARVDAQSIDDQIVRLRVYDVDVATQHQLDHVVLRRLRARTLHFDLKISKPESPESAARQAFRRRTIDQLVAEALARRTLPPGMDRAALLALGRGLMAEVSAASCGDALVADKGS